jgi:hypothetical protein
MGQSSRKPGISVAPPSGRELPRQQGFVRDHIPGLPVARLISVVSSNPKREESTMARSVIHPARTRQPQRTIEQRPVLQLPLDAPRWGEPPAQSEAREPSADRGVAVIDFFI